MANFDLILLALIAVFIFLRLKNVLGSRDGNEDNRNHYDPFNQDPMNDQPSQEEKADNVIHLPGAQYPEPDDSPVQEDVNEIEPVSEVQRGLADIMAADPTFDQHGFVEGVRGAFEMIITAFANDDRETLENLLSDEVNQNFVSALDARAAAGETLENTLVGVNSIEIIEAGLQAPTAEVTVRIISEQVNVTKDGDGEIVDGDANYIDTITDIWTFERDTTSRNPNWYLTATQTE